VREPFLRSFSSLSSSSDSWLRRVRENFQQIVSSSHFRASSANGAPIHLLQLERSKAPTRAQSYSVLTHAGLIGMILLFAVNHRRVTVDPPRDQGPSLSFTIPKDLVSILGIEKGARGTGGGGDHNPIPATSGNPPFRSSIQIVKPTIPEIVPHDLPVPPTILDPNAAAVLTPVQEIGLPWMKDRTQSAGPGANHGIGTGKTGGLGDRDGDEAGDSSIRGVYQPGSTRPACAYCPDPEYTDAAREAKLQGTVTMEVLVGPDGRAQRVRLLKGVGMGLDERAMEAVKTWKFIPARDEAKRPMAEWVTIEAMFRLF
jgi:periplasmic protein TonB